VETSIDTNYTNAMPGDCVLYEKEDIAFLLVPKCATSVIRDHETKRDGWSRMTVQDGHICPKKFVVILRDPVDRFLSTVNMYLGWREVEPQTDYVTFKFDEGNSFYLESNDAHFKPQRTFLIDMFKAIAKSSKKVAVDYFYYNKNIYKDINKEYGFDDFDLINVNKRLMQSTKIVNNVDESIIRQAYRADYDLINSVQFKNL
tara:strand:- start:4313 stop:4918 length:606 start_codon:yes stop_codon:yes gene_type:complete